MVCDKKHKHRNKPNHISDAEIMVILILFRWFQIFQATGYKNYFLF